MLVSFEQIKNANDQIKTTPIKGKEYAEVNQRIKAFRMVHPNGSITTDIVELSDGIVTIKATVANEGGCIIATGYAQEKESSSYINKTSYIENCETSAVGRALGFCGFGIDVSVASYEEVANAIENQQLKVEPLAPELLAEAERLEIDLANVAKYYKKHIENLTNADLQKCIERKAKAKEGTK